MIAIADSGSTKTAWLFADKNQANCQYKTIGLNPYFITKEQVVANIKSAIPANVVCKVTDLYFYGSGCANCDSYTHLEEGLQQVFENANIHIFSDMLGTARAVLQHDKGIAAILGTGSNSCFYDGKNITKNAISLGYILGDEGSGAVIGKMFVKRFLEGKFEPQLSQQIAQETGENITTILNAVYKGKQPNRYLANFTHCLANHIKHPEIQQVLHQAFSEFIENYIYIYQDFLNYQIGFCGSIAYHFSDILIADLEKIGYRKKQITIINDVLPELLKYHLN